MRADRLLALMMLLQTRGQMTAVALAEQLEVAPRTIYRDVEALSSAGVPIYAAGGPGGGYALLDSYRTTLTGLHEDEVKALFMMTIPGPMADLGMNQSLQSAVLKLTTALPTQYQAQANFVRQRLHLDAAAWFRTSESVPFLQVVRTAVWQDKQLQITYRRPSGRISERIVSPYALVAKAAVWYLVASTDDGMRVYRLSRLEAALMTEKNFSRPIQFDLAAYWNEWAADYAASLPQYRVRLKVEPNFLPILSAILGGQPLSFLVQSELSEDSWRILEVMFEHEDQACAIVLGMGASAQVISPTRLREKVLSSAQEIVALSSK